MRPTWLVKISVRVLSIAFALGAIALIEAGGAAAAGSCQLGPHGQVKHVIILQFDNVHLSRDNPSVPSDLEQMPALDGFITGNGTLLANDHTVLKAHTADGIVSTETGLYPDSFGGGVANSFPYLDPTQTGTHAGSSEVPGTSTRSLFTYWTDPVSASDPLYEMIHAAASASSPNGINTPAPWVPFTRAGCDFAGIGAANMELENDTSDLATVFGAGSTQAALGNWSYNTAYDQYFDAGSNLGTTDFEGLAIHCSQADSSGSGLCAAANGGAPDVLPDEPGGYSGYNALFGALAVDPALTGQPDTALPASYTPNGDTAPPAGNWQAPPVYDVFAPNATNSGPGAAPDPGNVDAVTAPPPDSYTPGQTPTTEILDSTGNPGFPGFDGMEANNALGYTAAAQEAGIPVTYTYLSDVHDDHYGTNNGNAFGPGEAGYEAQLRQYNAAFTAFFARLAADGINQTNTLFVVTADEGDHYAGGAPLNPGCDGVTVACQYDTAEAGAAAYGTSGYVRDVGEVDVNLPGLISGLYGDSTTFGFDNDDAPAIIVPNQSSATGPRPGYDDPVVRTLEREIGQASEYDPITGASTPVTQSMADETEEGILHMVNADPSRTPTLTLFGNPDFYFQSTCTDVGYAQGLPPAPVTNQGPGCPAQDNSYAWNHGGNQPEVATTWQGWVGPGVANLGETSEIWTDHADVRPTLMTLLGLKDDYTWDGRAIEQIMTPQVAPAHRYLLDLLGGAYKQLDAPFGSFAADTLAADTTALTDSAANDASYVDLVGQLQTCETARSALAARIQTQLAAAETGARSLDPWEALGLTLRAWQLVADTKLLEQDAGSPPTAAVCSASADGWGHARRG